MFYFIDVFLLRVSKDVISNIKWRLTSKSIQRSFHHVHTPPHGITQEESKLTKDYQRLGFKDFPSPESGRHERNGRWLCFQEQYHLKWGQESRVLQGARPVFTRRPHSAAWMNSNLRQGFLHLMTMDFCHWPKLVMPDAYFTFHLWDMNLPE